MQFTMYLHMWKMLLGRGGERRGERRERREVRERKVGDYKNMREVITIR